MKSRDELFQSMFTKRPQATDHFARARGGAGLWVAPLLILLLSSPACKGKFEDRGPCVNVTCSGYGQCVTDGQEVSCDCEPGYIASGLDCLRLVDDAGPDTTPPADAEADTSPGECEGSLALCGDQCVELMSHVRHCGQCFNDCTTKVFHARGIACRNGHCVYRDCVGSEGFPQEYPDGTWNSWLDCDGDPANGCETQRSEERCTCETYCDEETVCTWMLDTSSWHCAE